MTPRSITTSLGERAYVAISVNHDASVALFSPTRGLSALATERVTRIKHDHRGILATLLRLIDASNIQPDAIATILVSTSPSAWRETELGTELTAIKRLAPHATVVNINGHHLLHAHSAYMASGYQADTFLVVDGLGSPVGDRYECATALANPGMQVLRTTTTTYYPYNFEAEEIGLGRLYSYVTKHIFGDRYAAGKTMALASYGDATKRPSFIAQPSGRGLPAALSRVLIPGTALRSLSVGPVPNPMREADLAARVQADLEDGLLSLLEETRQLAPNGNHLALAGGVFLNCPANSRLQDSHLFEQISIPPAASDDGTALGALGWFAERQAWPIHSRPQMTDFLGPEPRICYHDLANSLQRCGIPSMVYETTEDRIVAEAAALRRGLIVAHYEGGSEFGPRALGHRSLLALPSSNSVREFINRDIKGREPFRPFAPVVQQSRVTDFFHVSAAFRSPHMLFTGKARRDTQRLAPAIVHIDGTARIQTVTNDSTSSLHGLLEVLTRLDQFPVLLNTSLNEMGRPIVETPLEALALFLDLPIDALVIGRLYAEKP